MPFHLQLKRDLGAPRKYLHMESASHYLLSSQANSLTAALNLSLFYFRLLDWCLMNTVSKMLSECSGYL